MHTTDAVLDQIVASRVSDQIDNVSFGYPEKRIVNGKGLVREQAE